MQIGSRKINPELISVLIKDIKKKKELKGVAEDFVYEYLKQYLAQNAKMITFLQKEFSRKKETYKQIIKKVRAKLRRTHSLFGVDPKKRKNYFNQLIKDFSVLLHLGLPADILNLHQKLLGTHSSTKERLSFYAQFYLKLFKITKKPKTILDLGCGLNPFSLPFMKLKKVNYYAYDINKEEISLVKKYFWFLEKTNSGFRGKVGILNSLQLNKIKKLPKADLCFLLKMTDVIDQGKGHKTSEEVIKIIPAKYIVVSFPTITIGGKPMNQPRRNWIELMCTRLNYSFKIIKEKNEIFYVIKK